MAHARGNLDVLITGEVFVDLVFTGVRLPEPGTESFADGFAFVPGGAANRAVTLARLGRSTAMLTDLGDDPLGRAVRAVLAGEPGLDLGWTGERAGWQTPISVAITDAHDRSFITYAQDAPRRVWPDDGPRIGVVHVGIADPIADWVHRLRRQGTLVVAGTGWDDSGTWDRRHLERLADVDVLVPNRTEAEHYTRTEDPAEAARALGRHVPLVVVTGGADGAVAYERESDTLIAVGGLPVAPVDPTGAGDAFVAAFMATYDLGWPLVDRLRLANLVAATTVTGLGGSASVLRPPQLLAALDQLVGAEEDWDLVRSWLTAATPGPQDRQGGSTTQVRIEIEESK